MRELTKEKVRNDHRRRTIQISDDGSQEQLDVSATEFQEIDMEEESDDSWQADEFAGDDLQCDGKPDLEEKSMHGGMRSTRKCKRKSVQYRNCEGRDALTRKTS